MRFADDEEIAAGDFAGTLRHVRATPTGFPQRDQLGTLLAEAYACSNTNNFVFGAVVVPWGVRGEQQLPRTEAQRAALAARVADVLWLETRVLRLFELARPELYVITEGSSSSSSSSNSSGSSSGSAELAELAELRQRLERLRAWSAAADGRLDAVAAAVAGAGGCDLPRPPAVASLAASLAAAPRVPSSAPVAAAAVVTPHLPGLLPGLPQAMLVVRRFDAAGRVSGANGARGSTLLDLLGQGLLLLPFRFGMGVWRRMDEHAEGGSAMHKRFALLHGAHKRVDLVCTRPALQGRGLQARLFARLCADADADGEGEGADCEGADGEGTLLYLSTSDPGNERYYTRFGFAPVGRFASPHGITTVGMARLPRRARERGQELVQVGELASAGAGGPSTSAPLLVVALGLAAAGALALRRAWAR